NVNVTFYDDIQPSKVYWFELEERGWFDNLSVVDYSHCRASEECVEASVYMDGVNQPRSIYFKASLTWKLKTANNESHQITVSSEITYYNGTAYRKVVLPIVLHVVADAGDCFETARTISFGNHTAFIEFIDDPEDWYMIWFEEGQSVSAMLIMQEPRGLYLDLYLYNPDGTLVANSSSREPNGIEQITHTISQSGNWYIRVLNPSAAETLYTLSIEEEQL
ncbi:MAG: PPC domain-containing protein, partial [Candidatus Bathyarchaeota archaeon]|nr:PPC domain-containing protein [Candidatus Bathyarchaeota archaeon]